MVGKLGFDYLIILNMFFLVWVLKKWNLYGRS